MHVQPGGAEGLKLPSPFALTVRAAVDCVKAFLRFAVAPRSTCATTRTWNGPSEALLRYPETGGYAGVSCTCTRKCPARVAGDAGAGLVRDARQAKANTGGM